MTEHTTRLDHTTKAFDTDLQDIKRRVAEMGGLAERQIADATRALVERDADLARTGDHHRSDHRRDAA